ncbi:MAG: hypothetical protein RMJ98_08095 [Myxococcales bacterium]|nr:hypothetical protein [Myxococcales bacterium]
MAFATKHYIPTTLNAEEILASLASLKITEDALEHRPGLPEPRIEPIPPPLPRVPPKKICFRGTTLREMYCPEERNIFPCRNVQGRIVPCSL